MPSPFPGMDPYLENPSLWPDVHHMLISSYREMLAAQLRRTTWSGSRSGPTSWKSPT